MGLFFRITAVACALLCVLSLAGCQGVGAAPSPPPPQPEPQPQPPPPQPDPVQIAVTLDGSGTGTATSTPTGINCGDNAKDCNFTFPAGSQVTLTATADSGFGFAGWSGACTGTGSCIITTEGNHSVTATFVAGLQSINHIIFMAQENRGFDHYFGKLNEYRMANGLPADVDVTPPDASNPSADGTGTVTPFHMQSMCIESSSPSWNESHVDWNLQNPVADTPTLDGFVSVAANHAVDNNLHDTQGLRAMAYYDSGDLPYYYFMASNFATSDRWFSSLMSRTQPNRMYMMAATSAGHVYSLPPGSPALPNKTIFELLQEHGISWKVYVTDPNPDPIDGTLFNMFAFSWQNLDKIVPISEFMTDVANGTLPAVAMIDPGYISGRDEHPAESVPSGSVQEGSAYVASLINALMQSPSWKDSMFILTWDEGGSFYDHVAPQPAVSPDVIPPSDLHDGDVCTQVTGPNCDFVFTGYRVPLIVASPFTKKNFVSHTVADHTAILKFIEIRFGLPSLTNRDAAQMDMTEFFDFVNAPWMIPPTPPVQPTDGLCYLDHLP
jgi:phospholipase C